MRWSKEKAWRWYNQLPWLCGFNYLPRTSVNYTDFWHTFDEKIIAQELGWAQRAGFNSVRVVLSFSVWQAEASLLLRRFDRFLEMATENGLSVMPCPLDDCGFGGQPARLGSQPAPVAGVHNSRATGSPGRDVVMDRTRWPEIQAYVQQLIHTFARDRRVLLWDLYNEPGNRLIFTDKGERLYSEHLEAYSKALMVECFDWARRIAPDQPLTVAGWHLPPSWEDQDTDIHTHPIDLSAFELSDVISFHAYCRPQRLHAVLDNLRRFERPLFCTEWMARQAGSLIIDQLPIFANHDVACYQWGLVKGLTQTHIPWPSIIEQLGRAYDDTDIWFHDLLDADGTPYDPDELTLIQTLVAEHTSDRNKA